MALPDRRRRLEPDRHALDAVDEVGAQPLGLAVELGGQQLHEGDKVALFYASANRDDSVFAEPDRFDITRTPNDHLAFGIGPHFCLGANLARLEIRVMFEEILRRLPDIELDGKPERLRSYFINGIKRMPIRFTPSAAIG